MFLPVEISMVHIAQALSQAMDLVDPAIVDHHRRVAGIARSLAEAADLGPEECARVTLAALLHDCGAFTLQERQETLAFDVCHTVDHALAGALLLADFLPFRPIAELVRYHHLAWDAPETEPRPDDPVRLQAQILYLADRIDVLLGRDGFVLSKAKAVRARIRAEAGRLFMPALVAVFERLAVKESFWLSVDAAYGDQLLDSHTAMCATRLSHQDLSDLARLFARLIDFRSRFTATHSSGVSAVATMLGSLCGLPESDQMQLTIAGWLHDVGKLAIPAEILEKPGKLTEEEFDRMRSHTFYTYSILRRIPGFDKIAPWAAFHHERLDGRGYPFHFQGEELTLGARIVAVADVFTAITEDRPYRPGMDKDRAIGILQDMATNQSLDAGIVTVLTQHYEPVSALRSMAQRAALHEYDAFWERLGRHASADRPSLVSPRA